MQLPHITVKQLQVLQHLYTFSYLNTNQLQKLFNHTNPRTIQEWLKDLVSKKYILPHDFNRHTAIANTKPTIYSLSTLARKRLKTEKGYDIGVLNRVYQEKKLTKQTMYQRVFLADMYLNLLAQLKDNEKLHFSTRAQLKSFDYFPVPFPDAYVALSSLSSKTNRYFIFLFTVSMPWRVLESRIEQYINYSEENKWSEVTNDPLPLFLFVCMNEKAKKKINELIISNLPRDTFYLATKENIIRNGFRGDVWMKVQ